LQQVCTKLGRDDLLHLCGAELESVAKRACFFAVTVPRPLAVLNAVEHLTEVNHRLTNGFRKISHALLIG
jgi:hypothetical protein